MTGPDPPAALDRLPSAYGLALRLRGAGQADEVIAVRLGIELEAVGPLLTIAEEKLAAILSALEP